MYEKRKYLRIPITGPVYGSTGFSGELVDLSISGCFIRTPLSLGPGTIVELHFTLPNNTSRIIHAKGEVRWTGRYSSDRRIDVAVGIGVRFVEIELDDVAAINEHVKETSSRGRRHPRAPLSLSISYGADSTNLKYKGEVLNISLSGIFIKAIDLLNLNDVVHMNFALPKSTNAINCSGKVVSINDNIPKIFSGFIQRGMGIEFTNISDKDVELIDEIIEKYFETALSEDKED